MYFAKILIIPFVCGNRQNYLEAVRTLRFELIYKLDNITL